MQYSVSTPLADKQGLLFNTNASCTGTQPSFALASEVYDTLIGVRDPEQLEIYRRQSPTSCSRNPKSPLGFDPSDPCDMV